MSQASINRRCMVGLMALRNAGSEIKLRRGDWPKAAESKVSVYSPEQLKKFFDAWDQGETYSPQI